MNSLLQMGARTPSDSDSGWRSVLRGFNYALVFILAFASLCGALHSLIPRKGIPQVSPKLDHLRIAGGNYDTIFIGSSRIRRHIDPFLFDRLCHDAGIETTSFNFGVDGMISPEILYVVDEILRINPPRLKRIIMDLNGFRRTFGRGNEDDSIRMVYWHDVPRTWLLIRALIEDPTGRSISERLDLGRRHLAVFARNFSTVGLAQPYLPSRRGSRRALQNESEWEAASRGFYPMDLVMQDAEVETYANSLKRLLQAPDRGTKWDPAVKLAHAQMAKALSKKQIRTYYIASPKTDALRDYTPSPGNTFSFDDPALYPTLYDARNCYDLQHLNASGARELTRLFAEQFIARMRRGE
jgi:hypothetical protein